VHGCITLSEHVIVLAKQESADPERQRSSRILRIGATDIDLQRLAGCGACGTQGSTA
jgi:hypothetical protein